MKGNLALLDVVAIERDLADKGLVSGQVGTIVECLADGVFAVEFSDDQARAYAFAALNQTDLLRLQYEPCETRRAS